MEQKNKLLPELRFPEFVNDGEWKEKPIEKVLIESRIPSIENDVNKRITVRLNLKGIEKREVRGTESENATYFFQRKKGQFIYGKQNLHKGAFGLIPEELDGYESSQDIPSFDFNDEFSPEFFVQYLSQENIYTQLEKISTGTGSKRIHPKDFYKVKYPFPHNIKEQQKIADCLTSLDELITAHTDKLESLKNHKKGLLQNLFPQENQKIPNYRFPEFVNDGEWEEKELNELGELINGLTYSPSDVQEEGLLVLRSSNIQNGLIDLKDCVYVRKDIKGANISQSNDILVCVRNGSKALIGKNALIPENLPLATHGAFMTVFRAKNPHFVFQLFQTIFYENQVNGDLGATINSINGKNFLKYKFPVPKNPKEQQKIADCLSAVDNLITAQTEKIEQLKAHKKGLMQGLFPKIEE